MALKLDKQKVILALMRYAAYLVNIIIIAIIASAVGFYIWSLIQAAQE